MTYRNVYESLESFNVHNSQVRLCIVPSLQAYYRLPSFPSQHSIRGKRLPTCVIDKQTKNYIKAVSVTQASEITI